MSSSSETRARWLVVAGVAAALIVLVMRHRRFEMGRRVPGGILIGDARIYDAVTHRLLLGSFFRGIGEDIARSAATGSRVLEVGCGPGHLSDLLAQQHGLDVTGVDLDPAMIDRARANANGWIDRSEDAPSFLVGDVASLPFPDGSFDLVVSTLSMHHWADPAVGLAEIRRVLRAGGRALIWDFGPFPLPPHGRRPDLLGQVTGSGMAVGGVTPWRWPWGLALTQRIDLAVA